MDFWKLMLTLIIIISFPPGLALLINIDNNKESLIKSYKEMTEPETHKVTVRYYSEDKLEQPDTLTLYNGNGEVLAVFSTADDELEQSVQYDELGGNERLMVHSEVLDKDMYFDTVEEIYEWYADDAYGAGEMPPSHYGFTHDLSNEIEIDYDTGEYETWWLDSDEVIERDREKFDAK